MCRYDVFTLGCFQGHCLSRAKSIVTDCQIVCRLQNVFFFYGYSERRLVFVNFVFPVLNINCIILDKRFVERLSAVSGNSASSS